MKKESFEIKQKTVSSTYSREFEKLLKWDNTSLNHLLGELKNLAIHYERCNRSNDAVACDNTFEEIQKLQRFIIDKYDSPNKRGGDVI